MDEQLKALLEGINALKSGQEETKERMEIMQRSQEETKESVENMQRSQEETKNELKEGMQKCLEDMQKSQAETKNELKTRMEKDLENVQKCQEDLRNTLEKKIDSRVEDIKKKLLVSGKKNESKILPSSPVPVSTSPVPVTASTVSVKLSRPMTEKRTGKGDATEIPQTLPDTERLNLNFLYNALDLRFIQKYSKDYARLQMKTRPQKTGESLHEYASEVERLANLAFSDHSVTVREAISLQYFVDGLKDGEIQNAVRMADVQELKSPLLYGLKLEAKLVAELVVKQVAETANLSEELG
ncbi:uncharacterized protein TNCV_3432411 [Trichonephila clavipes]|nr:uncharacterized protein TNCV_3432411 [Trichonephila clavipes]